MKYTHSLEDTNNNSSLHKYAIKLFRMLKPRMNNKEEYTTIESPYKSKIVVPVISVQIQ